MDKDKEYRVLNKKTGEILMLRLDTASDEVELDGEEILWALEEYGVCEVDDYEIKDV